jgi:hypothetical protein
MTLIPGLSTDGREKMEKWMVRLRPIPVFFYWHISGTSWLFLGSGPKVRKIFHVIFASPLPRSHLRVVGKGKAVCPFIGIT